jgi:D-arabinose 1-dehydrogenase-like Zn-dependent alcohol dehydrogenase
MAQYFGFYRGLRHQRGLTRKLLQQTTVPESYQRVEITGPDVHELKETQLPPLQKGEVLVRVGYAGVSPEEIAAANSPIGPGGEDVFFHPIIPGVEFSGIVVKVGPGPNSIQSGQKIAGTYFSGCGDCVSCANGAPQDCADAQTATRRLKGGYGQYCVISSKLVQRLPADMSLKQGALLADVAACCEGLEQLGNTKEGQLACVIGSGSLGNICAQILSNRGLEVSMVDDRSRWLGLMAKYDVSTLSKLDSTEKYDYLVATESEQNPWDGSNSNYKLSAKFLAFRSAPANDGGHSAPENPNHAGVTYSNGAVKPSSWEEAVRLVLSGRVNLADHMAAVKSLEDYREAWEQSANGEQFKTLLSVNQDLELL